jgi:hypothetical protein
MELFDWLFIISGIIFFSSIIGVFILMANDKSNNVKVFGVILAVLMLPLIAILINYIAIGKGLNFIIYLVFILLYLVVEFLLDMVFKIDFRSKPSRHVPYIILEYAACFSFVFGSLRLNLTLGWIVSFFFWAFMGALVYLIIKRRKKNKK